MSEADLTVSEGYSAWAANYDAGFNPLIALEKVCLATLGLPMHPKRVLDLATGTGRHALHFALQGSMVTALDASAAMLKIAKEKQAARGLKNLDFIEAQIDKALPVKPGSYDFAICSLALCHIPEIRSVFQSAFEALGPNGLFIVTDLHPVAVAAGFGVLFQNGHRLTSIASVTHDEGSYEAEMKAVGFTVMKVVEQPLGMAFTKKPGDLPEAIRNTDWRKLPFCLAISAKKPGAQAADG